MGNFKTISQYRLNRVFSTKDRWGNLIDICGKTNANGISIGYWESIKNNYVTHKWFYIL